jgi:hypothetical protein
MSKSADEGAILDGHDSTEALSLDWPMFTQQLASVLSRLEKDQYLIVSARNSNRFGQFACKGAGGMRAEVTSNKFLERADKLKRGKMSWLRSHGWNAPTPAGDPKGSPNYYIDFPTPSVCGEIADAAVEALVNALEIPHPGAMVYTAFDSNGGTLPFEDLGLRPSAEQASDLLARDLRGVETPTMFGEESGPLDEGDPEVQEEMFQTMKFMGAEPKDLVDAEEREQYAAWLVLNSRIPDEEAEPEDQSRANQ